MPTQYKTPGVYIEEIPKFPPSIAAVETAIPAFIGYTEKATRNGESLTNKPTRIESIAEYELLFGGAPSQNVTLFLDADNQFVKAAADDKLYLYDSLRMFYANGGGNCYILSVGAYGSAASLKDGLAILEQEDEPTIILCPDAVSLPSVLYEFQKKALEQCNKLKDRVTLCDLEKGIDNTEFKQNVSDFRDKIGINSLKYGAAYGPWMKANLPRTLLRRNVTLKSNLTNGLIQLRTLSADTEIQSLIDDVINAENLVDKATAVKKTLAPTPLLTLEDPLKGLLDDYNNVALPATPAQIETALLRISVYMVSIINEIQLRYVEASGVASSRFKLQTDIDKFIANSNIKGALGNVAKHHNHLKAAATASKDAATAVKDVVATEAAKAGATVITVTTAATTAVATVITAAAATVRDAVTTAATAVKAAVADEAAKAGATVITVTTAATTAVATVTAATAAIKLLPDVVANDSLDRTAKFLGFADGAGLLALVSDTGVSGQYTLTTTAKQRGDVAIGTVVSGVKAAISFFSFLESTQNSYEKTFNDALLSSFGTYNNLVTKAADVLNILPPSGAIAGVYAATDRERGVWKAPANTSLNAVIAPAVNISHEQQGEFNVDVNAGKSINIIRPFRGKGTLVWGARTLAGNDNEWRYISVRRFFNFVEESTKKATEQFVFEPNDANTWVKVQGMIENFLTTLWRQGALQGIKPEHAFYVAVGLGKTMTPLDILEGRMIIEIGMAAVRPAEFIILRFSHKMPES